MEKDLLITTIGLLNGVGPHKLELLKKELNIQTDGTILLDYKILGQHESKEA